jgi:hypothetical protein
LQDPGGAGPILGFFFSNFSFGLHRYSRIIFLRAHATLQSETNFFKIITANNTPFNTHEQRHNNNITSSNIDSACNKYCSTSRNSSDRQPRQRRPRAGAVRGL